MNPLRGLRNALILSLGFIAFAPVLHVGFQLDDHRTIEANPFIRRWTADAFKNDFFPDRQDAGEIYYRPLQSVVNRLLYSVEGLNPAGYHLINLLLHLGNAVMIAELVLLLSFPPWAALATGLLFVVNPLIVSELLMASGIPEIMSLFFGLAALLFLLQNKPRLILPGLFAYSLALFSKESAISVPLYFGLLCRYRQENNSTRLQWMGLAAVTAAYIGLRTAVLGHAGVHVPLDAWVVFLAGRFPGILLRYAGLVFFPWHLHSYRLIPQINPFWGWSVGLLLWEGYVAAGKPAWARFCFLWLLASFLPKIPLLATGHYMLEHWVYPGLLAFLLPLSLLLTKGWLSPRPRWQRSATVLFALLLCFDIFSAQFHIAVRKTDEQNYRWSLQFTRATPLLFNLGLICLRTGRAAEAVTCIEPVHALYPDDANISRALATARAHAGQ